MKLSTGISCLLSSFLASCATMPQRVGTYQLPLAPGASSRLIQGNNGPYGHSGALAYAFDFLMPIGTPLRAARGGVVQIVEERFADNTRKPGEENLIVINHGDGTFGRYYHLTTNGSDVTVGQRVRAGQPIGRSGNSGASAGPHLHFDVTSACPEFGCQTAPIQFTNSTDPVPQAGRTYSVLPR